MAEHAPTPFVASVRLAVPVAGALGLVVALRALLSPPRIDVPVAVPIVDAAALAGLCWGGQLWYVGRTVDDEWTDGHGLRSLLGLANWVTVARGGLFAVVGGFVLVPPGADVAWVAALAYGVGVAMDALDGAVARTVGNETDLGERLDMAFDTFGFVVAPLVAVAWGALPAWYLSLSAARYVYRGGLAWRRRRGRPLFDPPDSDVGRYLAGVQMAFLTAALTPVVSRAATLTLAPAVLAPSLLVFVRDYLVVSGRLSWDER